MPNLIDNDKYTSVACSIDSSDRAEFLWDSGRFGGFLAFGVQTMNDERHGTYVGISDTAALVIHKRLTERLVSRGLLLPPPGLIASGAAGRPAEYPRDPKGADDVGAPCVTSAHPAIVSGPRAPGFSEGTIQRYYDTDGSYRVRFPGGACQWVPASDLKVTGEPPAIFAEGTVVAVVNPGESTRFIEGEYVTVERYDSSDNSYYLRKRSGDTYWLFQEEGGCIRGLEPGETVPKYSPGDVVYVTHDRPHGASLATGNLVHLLSRANYDREVWVVETRDGLKQNWYILEDEDFRPLTQAERAVVFGTPEEG